MIKYLLKSINTCYNLKLSRNFPVFLYLTSEMLTNLSQIIDVSSSCKTKHRSSVNQQQQDVAGNLFPFYTFFRYFLFILPQYLRLLCFFPHQLYSGITLCATNIYSLDITRLTQKVAPLREQKEVICHGTYLSSRSSFFVILNHIFLYFCCAQIDSKIIFELFVYSVLLLNLCHAKIYYFAPICITPIKISSTLSKVQLYITLMYKKH